MKALKFHMIVILITASLSCVSAKSRGSQDDVNSNDVAQPSPLPVLDAKASPQPGSDEEALLFMDRARDAMDNNHLTEAIKAYITVLAISEQNSALKKAAEASKQAQTELTKIGTRLSIEPNEAWLESTGKQLGESTRNIGQSASLQPAVYLYENFGSGKAPIADAPIAFEFVENSGTMNGFVNTDSFGRANTTILKLTDPSKPATIRAQPVFKSRGYSYSFKNVFRDFNYLPPANTVLALSLSRSELGTIENSLSSDIMAPELKSIGLQVVPAAGSLQKDAFLAAFQGDGQAVLKLLAQAKASYLLLVFIDLDSVKQYEYQGKLYNMYSAYGKALLRLIRSDGTIVYSIPIEKLKGDGGTKSKAVDAAIIQANDQLVKGLNANLSSVRGALIKD
jgi:hypothetical protein